MLNEELSESLDRAVTLAELEDLYRPYRPKRRTRASQAKERGIAASGGCPVCPAGLRSGAGGPGRRTGIRKKGVGVGGSRPSGEPGIFWRSGLRTTPPAGQGCGPLAASGELTSQAADEIRGVCALRRLPGDAEKIPRPPRAGGEPGRTGKRSSAWVWCVMRGRALSLLTAAHVRSPLCLPCPGGVRGCVVAPVVSRPEAGGA